MPSTAWCDLGEASTATSAPTPSLAPAAHPRSWSPTSGPSPASATYPPGTKPIDPLVDVLVHGQGIAVPLRIDRPMPAAAAVAAAERVWVMSCPFFARRRFRGVR